MISALVKIIIGALIWKLAPSLFTVSSKSKDIVNIICTVVGLLFLISGAIDLFSCL
jgi:hypothetical protein